MFVDITDLQEVFLIQIAINKSTIKNFFFKIDYIEFQAWSTDGAGSGAGGSFSLSINGEIVTIPASGMTVRQNLVGLEKDVFLESSVFFFLRYLRMNLCSPFTIQR